MRRIFYLIGLVLVMLGLSSCARVVNPYHSEFECPQAEKGKCVSIQQAYKESLESERNLVREFENATRSYGNETFPLRDETLLSPAEKRYVESLYDVLTRLLKDPKTPVVTPPRIVRVLILPYQGIDEKKFYSARYVYVIVDEPKWVLQNILNMPAAEE